MIAVLQRGSEARVLIAGKVVGEIGAGLQVQLVNDGPVTTLRRYGIGRAGPCVPSARAER